MFFKTIKSQTKLYSAFSFNNISSTSFYINTQCCAFLSLISGCIGNNTCNQFFICNYVRMALPNDRVESPLAMVQISAPPVISTRASAAFLHSLCLSFFICKIRTKAVSVYPPTCLSKTMHFNTFTGEKLNRYQLNYKISLTGRKHLVPAYICINFQRYN